MLTKPNFPNSEQNAAQGPVELALVVPFQRALCTPQRVRRARGTKILQSEPFRLLATSSPRRPVPVPGRVGDGVLSVLLHVPLVGGGGTTRGGAPAPTRLYPRRLCRQGVVRLFGEFTDRVLLILALVIRAFHAVPRGNVVALFLEHGVGVHLPQRVGNLHAALVFVRGVTYGQALHVLFVLARALCPPLYVRRQLTHARTR